MTLNDLMTLILRYFTEFSTFRCQLRQSGWKQTYAVGDKNAVQRI